MQGMNETAIKYQLIIRWCWWHTQKMRHKVKFSSTFFPQRIGVDIGTWWGDGGWWRGSINGVLSLMDKTWEASPDSVVSLYMVDAQSGQLTDTLPTPRIATASQTLHPSPPFDHIQRNLRWGPPGWCAYIGDWLTHAEPCPQLLNFPHLPHVDGGDKGDSASHRRTIFIPYTTLGYGRSWHFVELDINFGWPNFLIMRARWKIQDWLGFLFFFFFPILARCN